MTDASFYNFKVKMRWILSRNMRKGFSKTNMEKEAYFLVLGELENGPAERTVPSVDPLNLNQVILAEGKQ